MPDSSLYQPSEPILVRTPLLALDRIRSWYTGSDESLPGLDELIDDSLIMEAVLSASTDLYDACMQYAEGKRVRDQGRIHQALLRYLIRMSTRPTPFGLLAGSAVVYPSAAMNIVLEKHSQGRTVSRPSLQLILDLVQAIEERPGTNQQLRYRTNPGLYVSGGRVYLPYEVALDDQTEEQVSVRATSAVLSIIDAASSEQGWHVLQDRLLASGNATIQQVEGFLGQLIRHKLLMSDLQVALTGPEPLQAIIDRSSELSGCEDVNHFLREYRQQLEDYDRQPVGRGSKQLHKLKSVASDGIASKSAADVAIDLIPSLAHEEVAEHVLHEIARTAELMMRVGGAPNGLRHIHEFARSFAERYGEGREIPVSELLDPDFGHGAPATYLHPVSKRSIQPAIGNHRRDTVLIQAVTNAVRAGSLELWLDGDLEKELEPDDEWERFLPPSVDIFVSVAGKSQEAINAGEYTIVVGPRTGDHPAGRTAGRFARNQDENFVQSLRHLVHEPSCDVINAELIYLPSNGRVANLALRPRLHPYEVVVSGKAGVEPDQVIAVADLVAGVRDGRFYFRSLMHQKEVRIHSSHLLNYLHAPNVCRFLHEVSSGECISMLPFNWGAATYMPFLPRLRTARAVLAPAQWHLPIKVLRTETGEERSFHTSLSEWCERWRVPRHVYLTLGDARLLLDLSTDFAKHELAREARGRGANEVLVLQEMFPDFDDTWTCGADGTYHVELVVPARRSNPGEQRPRLRRRPSQRLIPEHHVRSPGSDWLYFKLLCDPRDQVDFLTGPINSLTSWVGSQDLIQRWFYVRYADPIPQLRLRFQVKPGQLAGRLLPELISWCREAEDSGLIQSFSIDSYDREVERYGGPEGMDIAESIFAADSTFVVRLLEVQGSSPGIDLEDTAILSTDHMLARLGISASERLELYTQMAEGQSRALSTDLGKYREGYRQNRGRYTDLVGNRPWLFELVGEQVILPLLDEFGCALADDGHKLIGLDECGGLWVSRLEFLASCVHMHCNRLLGTDRQQELKVLYLLMKTYQALRHHVPPGVVVPH